MPSPRHDAVNQLFRERPELAVEILRDLLGLDVPIGTQVRVTGNDFNDRPSKDFQPDTVITLGPARAPVHGIVVEVQQEKTEAKRRQLPRYAMALWLTLRRPVTLLCVCADADAAAWYAEPIPIDVHGMVFRPFVLGPHEIPVIMDPQKVAMRPDLAALSVMVHGLDPRVVEAFVAGLVLVSSDHAELYVEYAHSMAGPKVRRLLEEIMTSSTWVVSTPFAREHFGRGKAEGRAEGWAEAILRVLAARKVEVPDDARARILACTDTRQLDTWLDLAVTVTDIADLFE